MSTTHAFTYIAALMERNKIPTQGHAHHAVQHSKRAMYNTAYELAKQLEDAGLPVTYPKPYTHKP